MTFISAGVDPVSKLIEQVKDLQKRVEELEKAHNQQQHKERVVYESKRML